jgi:hypothetical protein
VKSKERPNRSEGKIQNECGEEGKVVYFVEVFLIVTNILRKCEESISRTKDSPLVLSLGQANRIDVQMSYSERNRCSEMTVRIIPLFSHMSGEPVI